MLTKFTDQEFATKVLQADQPVLVDFWAPWCGPCQMQNPILEELNKELGKKGMIAKVNVDENQQLAQKYGVMSIPTLLLFNKGHVVKQWMGVQNKETLKAEFHELLKT